MNKVTVIDNIIYQHGFGIKSYFSTGDIPYPAKYADDGSISDAVLVDDCLEACAFIHYCKELKLPYDNQIEVSLQKAAKLLGMDSNKPYLPATGSGFIEYGKRSGLLT